MLITDEASKILLVRLICALRLSVNLWMISQREFAGDFEAGPKVLPKVRDKLRTTITILKLFEGGRSVMKSIEIDGHGLVGGGNGCNKP